jgi:hypothetical protein
MFAAIKDTRLCHHGQNVQVSIKISLHDKSHAANPRLLRMVLSEVPGYNVLQSRLDTEHDMSSRTFRIVCWRPRYSPDLERGKTHSDSTNWLMY